MTTPILQHFPGTKCDTSRRVLSLESHVGGTGLGPGPFSLPSSSFMFRFCITCEQICLLGFALKERHCGTPECFAAFTSSKPVDELDHKALSREFGLKKSSLLCHQLQLFAANLFVLDLNQGRNSSAQHQTEAARIAGVSLSSWLPGARILWSGGPSSGSLYYLHPSTAVI